MPRVPGMPRRSLITHYTGVNHRPDIPERARDAGYDGVLGIRISHPTITGGAIEVVVAGTGFRYRECEMGSEP